MYLTMTGGNKKNGSLREFLEGIFLLGRLRRTANDELCESIPPSPQSTTKSAKTLQTFNLQGFAIEGRDEEGLRVPL